MNEAIDHVFYQARLERVNQLKQQFDSQAYENEKLLQSTTEYKKEIQMKENENRSVRSEIEKVKKSKEIVSRKLTTTEDMRSELEKNKACFS